MNSITIVEGQHSDNPRYMTTLMSKVKKVKSARSYSHIAAATDEKVRTRQPRVLKENATDNQMSEAGKSA
ncbi:MAG: hypothetical protein MUP90_03985 [Gammaproteobacteria bacterium]|nr:hypothetical protein [Gammaproteobacteria bacterium]